MVYFIAEITDMSNGNKRVEYCMCMDEKIIQNAPLFNENMKLKKEETINLIRVDYDDWSKQSNNVGWEL